jgi:hypothetical protein
MCMHTISHSNARNDDTCMYNVYTLCLLFTMDHTSRSPPPFALLENKVKLNVVGLCSTERSGGGEGTKDGGARKQKTN